MAGSGVQESLLSLLPTTARVYIESVLLGEKSPITAEDFTPAELEAIKQVILLSVKGIDEKWNEDRAFQGINKLEARQSFATRGEKKGARSPRGIRRTLGRTPGVVDYGTYRKSKATGGDDANAFGLDALRNPLARTKHTLGQFNYSLDDLDMDSLSTEGDVVVTDKYNFSKYLPEDITTAQRVLEAIKSLGYSELRNLGAERLPEGTGREVEVALPRDMFSPEELEALFGTEK